MSNKKKSAPLPQATITFPIPPATARNIADVCIDLDAMTNFYAVMRWQPRTAQLAALQWLSERLTCDYIEGAKASNG